MKLTIFRRFVPAAAFLGLFFLTAPRVDAVSVTYTFEQFAQLQGTPITNAPPDSGPASFLANFTSSPTANGFIVANAQQNGLFSGNELIELSGPFDTLTLTFNMAVDSVSLVFATNGAATLFFSSPSGNTSVTSTAQSGGAGFPGGILTFSSLTPFTTFSLNTGGNGPEFAIDNLVMNIADTNGAAVPDGGSTLAMAGMAALLLLGFHRLGLKQVAA